MKECANSEGKLNFTMSGALLLGDFNAKVGRENIFKRLLGMRVHIRIAMIMGLE